MVSKRARAQPGGQLGHARLRAAAPRRTMLPSPPPPRWLSSLVSCLSAASVVSPVHLLHASLNLTNTWISGYAGLGRRGWEKQLLGCCCHRAASALLLPLLLPLLLLLLPPFGLPAHHPLLPGPCSRPCDEVLLHTRHQWPWRGESRQTWSAGRAGTGMMGPGAAPTAPSFLWCQQQPPKLRRPGKSCSILSTSSAAAQAGTGTQGTRRY